MRILKTKAPEAERDLKRVKRVLQKQRQIRTAAREKDKLFDGAILALVLAMTIAGPVLVITVARRELGSDQRERVRLRMGCLSGDIGSRLAVVAWFVAGKPWATALFNICQQRFDQGLLDGKCPFRLFS